MNRTTLNALAAAVSLAFSAAAMGATPMSKADYSSGKDSIQAEYKSSRAACDSLKANAKDICIAEAKGKESVALADLAVAYKPTTKSRYDARLAKADADFAVSKEKCDDQAGNAKDVCVKEAQAAHVTAKADAKAHMKTVEAHVDANKQVADAQKTAASDKRDADYAVAKEKCDAQTGDTKDRCIHDAKALYGKS
jgi:hypothetical protein